MNRSLVANRALFEVPKDLTYFVHDEDHLVVNPEAGARCVLKPREFEVLRALVRTGPDGDAEALGDPAAAERTLTKLILNWIVYYNGNKPSPAHAEPQLNYLYYAITDGCNLRCPYCYASSEKCLPGEMTTAESMNLVTQAAEMGANVMVFTGGEPMLRKDLFRVVQHAVDSGLKANIITNATMIRKPETAQRFAELFSEVIVSVDGATAATHDRTRGKGSFAKTYQALRLLNAAGVKPRINHIVTSDHIDELEEFAAFIQGIDVLSVRLMNHDKLGRGADDEFDFGWRDHMRVQQIVWGSEVAAKLQPDGPRPVSPCSIKGNCGMGGNEIYVNSLGDVYPCKLVTGRAHRAGNLRTQSLSEIFGAPMLRDMRRSTVFGGDYHADCAKCYVRSSCGGGCRATHLGESGDVRRNSRHVCRILRHGVVSQLWMEAGVSRAELAAKSELMTEPRLVADGTVHPVFDDWKTYTPQPAPVELRQLLPLTPVQRRMDSAASGQ